MGWASVHPTPLFLLPQIVALPPGFGFLCPTRVWESGRQTQSWALVPDFRDLWGQNCIYFSQKRIPQVDFKSSLTYIIILFRLLKDEMFKIEVEECELDPVED
eukprot:bmy_07968T0